MQLDLIADERLARERHRFLDQRDGEVRHADVAGNARLLDLAKRAERLGERDARVRPMQQEQIDLGKPQPRQAVLRCAFELARRKVRRPDFGGDKHLVALDARARKPSPASRSLSYISAVSIWR
jgi:hypothetical protein